MAPASIFQNWNIEDTEIHTFKLYWPALISAFEVFNDFMADDKHNPLRRGKSLGYQRTPSNCAPWNEDNTSQDVLSPELVEQKFQSLRNI